MALSAACLGGCSRSPEATYPVEGTVTLDGTPLDGGNVLFELVSPASDGKRYTARGEIGPDGRYRLSTFGQNDGAVAGRCRVAVFPKQGPLIDRPNAVVQSSLPTKYSSPESSGLEYEVKAGKNSIDIELTALPHP